MATASTSVERDIRGLGGLRGRLVDGVEVYRGVPYAEPPAGSLRFAPPVPRAAWGVMLDAGRDRAIAPQTESRVYHALGSTEGEIGEDCLNLSIWVPVGCDNAPVMLWIHGGGFMTGSGSLPWYDGQRLALERGVIVVTCNYRLGAAGYLAIQGVTNGNFGVMDQIAALQWVHDHIADFGGDPSNVTLFGESAGGHAIASMLLTPTTEGLFHRAILQSPPLGIPPEAPENSQRRAVAFVGAAGLSLDDPNLLANLRQMSVEEILRAQIGTAIALQRMNAGDITPPFIPSDATPSALEGADFVDRVASEAARRGIEVLIGWTRDEGALFMSNAPVRSELSEAKLEQLYVNAFGPDGARELEAARQRRKGATPEVLLDEMVTQSVFRRDSIRFAQKMAEQGGTVFVYRFDWASPEPTLRACHCSDLPFTFGAFAGWHGAVMVAGVTEDEAEPVAEAVMSRWSSFARSGDPGLPRWDNERPSVLLLGKDVAVQAVDDLALL